MSKPNLLAFSSSVGIYRNKRMRDLSRLLSKSAPQFSNMAPMLFQVTMAYAAENQIDGNFQGYTTQDWTEIFVTNNVPVTPSQATAIVKGFREVGLFDGDKIRSWLKYNRHLGDYEGIVRRKRKAAKEMHRKREEEARERHVDPSKNGENPTPKSVQKAAQKDSPSKQLYLVNQALETARGRARKELLIQKQQLLSAHTGVDLTPPPPSPAPPPAKPPRKITAAEQEAEYLSMAQTTLADYPDGLSERMVTALVKAGHRLPGPVKSRFRDLVAKLQA